MRIEVSSIEDGDTVQEPTYLVAFDQAGILFTGAKLNPVESVVYDHVILSQGMHPVGTLRDGLAEQFIALWPVFKDAVKENPADTVVTNIVNDSGESKDGNNKENVSDPDGGSIEG